MNQHVFFQQFGFPQEQPTPEDTTYLHNCMILELANNWPFVRWMLIGTREGFITEIDPIEQHWYQFISTNNIDIDKYEKDSDAFMRDYLIKTS
jgi:hypothetical protein